MSESTVPGTIVALDVGMARVGVAVASTIARLPRPLVTLPNDETLWDTLLKLLAEEQATTVVVGLPRNLSGQDTEQTKFSRAFAQELDARYDGAVALQDEAMTSVKAERELRERKKTYEKSDIDSLAATYILEDYIHTQGLV